MSRILIADDEPAIVMAVEDELRFEGYDVTSVGTGPDAVASARSLRPDVLLLDLMLPGMNGFAVCRTLRPEQPNLWIIMLTVRGQEVDRITGFEAGADDYVTKPFSLREIVSRVKVGLRRAGGRATDQRRQTFGALAIDLPARRVFRRGVELELTPKEFEILALLVRRAGEVISRDEFLDAIWGRDVHVTHRTVDTHMSSLRRKIEADADHPELVTGVRGIGYRFEPTSTKS
jgi:two-component system alkaline phosphatase synthesis response regulator PhoP